MRNEIRSWTIFAIGAVWVGCLIALGNMLYRAPLATQSRFMFLFAAVFVAGMVGVMMTLPDKE